MAALRVDDILIARPRVPTSSHALLSVLAAHGVDRIFLVPGESYLGILDGLNEYPHIDVVTCRHEAGAGFMACADGRLTRRPGVVMVSRGPGASNAAIAIHTAQQDAIPLIVIVGQVPKSHLRKHAFQEIDYQHMYGAIAKWVVEVSSPQALGEAAFKAIRVATTGTPGPVVLVVPEDVQQQDVDEFSWISPGLAPTTAERATRDEIRTQLRDARRPLLIAGGMMDQPGGRAALLAFAQAWNIPVAVAFRRHDLFPNRSPLYVGDLGLANPREQIEAFRECDLILALGTRLDDVTTQGYRFPNLPQPSQTLIHCYPDPAIVGAHFTPRIGLACNPVTLARDLMPEEPFAPDDGRQAWNHRLRGIYEKLATWPIHNNDHALDFVGVVRAVQRYAPEDAIVSLDAGTFAAPVYRHFPFMPPQRLMAPLSGAMGYGVPAAVAAQLRHPDRKVICMVGDGGFMMTGNEMILAAKRALPILFLLANNHRYGSIRLHQDAQYPGRHLGTDLYNPDFQHIASGFGLPSKRISSPEQIDAAIQDAMRNQGPQFLEFATHQP